MSSDNSDELTVRTEFASPWTFDLFSNEWRGSVSINDTEALHQDLKVRVSGIFQHKFFDLSQ